MSKILSFSLVVVLASSVYPAEICRYQKFTHYDYALNLIDEIGNDARGRFRAAVDNLQGNYTKFTKKVAELDLGELGAEVVKCTNEVTNAVRKAFESGEEVYLEKYKHERDTGLVLIETLSSGVRSVLNSALSKAGRACNPKVQKITEAKITEADDNMRECIQLPAEIVRKSIDKMSRVFESVNEKYCFILDETLKVVKNLKVLKESTVDELKAFQTEAEQKIQDVVLSEKEVIPVAKETYEKCAEGVKTNVEATVETVIGALTSIVGGILGGL